MLGLALYLSVQFWEQLWAWISPYFHFLTDKERVKAAIKAAGPLAPLLFIVIQTVQVVVAPIPGEATGFIGVEGPDLPQRSAAMYGMMGTLPNRGDLKTLVLDLLDQMFTAEQ